MSMHHDKKLYGTATVGTKGQVVIPAEAREELGIKTGDKVYVVGSEKAGIVALLPEGALSHLIEKLNLSLESLKTITRQKDAK